jgi:uncharacterized protein
MDFLNREHEQSLIREELAKDSSRFIVLYGRRRIGKSALLQHISDPNSVYYLADINETNIQRGFFANQLNPHIPGFDAVEYPDWNTFFEQINQRLRHRITIIIDEFPYLVKSSPELPSVLQKIIDLQRNSMFHLILCGSSQQMMQGLVLSKSAPLFGRAHRILSLSPMDPRWLAEALQMNPVQTIEEFSIWGGIPRYWELRTEYKSLSEAIRELILNPYGVLHEEPLRLFMDDLNNAVQPISIASLIGQGCNKLSEIAGRLSKPATSLNRSIQNMIDTGYVVRDTCWGESGRNSKKTLYRILDPLSRFFFTFVVPNQSKLNSGHIDLVLHEFMQRRSLYVSQTWEELCRQSVAKLEIDGQIFLPAQRWWQQSQKNWSAEIDIIAESTDGNCLLIGEAKWQSKAKPQAIEHDLNKKLQILQPVTKYQRIYKLICVPDTQEKTDGDILWRNADFICQ